MLFILYQEASKTRPAFVYILRSENSWTVKSERIDIQGSYIFDFAMMIQLSLFYKAQYYKFASEGWTICTHTTSLTFDPKQIRRKKLSREKKGEEIFRRATEEDPSPGWIEQ